MRTFVRTRRGAALIGGLVLAGTLLAGGVVSAQTPSPTPAASPAARGTPSPEAQARIDARLARLASNLGVDVAKLRAALTQTALQELDDAVTAGRLTPAQAQQLRDRINSGQGVPFLGGHGFDGHRGGPGKGHGGEPFGRGPGLGVAQDGLATFLGVTPEQLRTERATQSLAQVAQAHGKSPAQLKQFLTEAAKQALAVQVTAGRLTQAQADEHLQRLEAGLDQAINAVGKPAMGPGRGPGMAPIGARS